MKYIIILLFVVTKTTAQKLLVNGHLYAGSSNIVAQFHFTLTGNPNPVSNWVLLTGNPNAAVMTATDNRSGNSIGITTVATGDTYWTDNGTAAAGYVLEIHDNGDFPAAVGSGYLFTQSTSSPANGNLHITGLNPSSTYTFEILTDRPQTTDNRRTFVSVIDSLATFTLADANSAPSTSTTTSTYRQVTNAGTVVIATGLRPKTNGQIWIRIAAATGFTFGYCNAIRIIETN
jgi:hypothetical protein